MGSVRAARQRMEEEAAVQASPGSMYSQDFSSAVQPTRPLASNNSSHQTQERGNPPQRPQRPNFVPSLVTEQQTHQQMGNYTGQSQQYNRSQVQQQQGNYWEPNYSPITPGAASSRDSAGSSVGSIPDFPVPTLPANTNQRRGQTGPPPTQRRGPSSYYSQNSFVLPIPEEGIEMPQHPAYRRDNNKSDDWQKNIPEVYIDRSSVISGPGEHMIEPIGLVRNASMGKQYKPSLTTVRPANETLRQQKGFAAPRPTVVDRSHLAAEHTVFVESVDSDDDNEGPHGRNSMEGETFLRKASEDSVRPKDDLLGEKEILVSPESSRASSPMRDPRVQHLMSGLEKGGAIPAGTAIPMLEGRPKPTAFDFHAETSNRASLASLTDLVRRATKVRTNLEKGRTASRLGLLDFFSSSKPDLLKVQDPVQPRESLTDMLESFPPPALNTPRDDRSARWPSPFVNEAGEHPYQKPERHRRTPEGRRCCGLPLWGFILALLLLIVLVAAAVLIPIFLIVIPNQNKNNAVCSKSFPCSNGGYSFTATDGCRCICAGGFTGSQCNQSPPVASDCTTANLDSFSGVTIGTTVLPLLSSASKYSIPLNHTLLLSDFSNSKLFCGDENNLVTFLNAASSKKRDLPTPVLTAREPQDSIIVDGSPSTTGSGAAPSPSNPSKNQLGFAQTSILYILQEASLDSARSMRYQLDQAFQNGNWTGPVMAGLNYTVDLKLLKITVNDASVGTGS